MKLVSTNIMLAWALLLCGISGFTREIPVLPFPQYVEQGAATIPFTSRISFDIKGLDKQASVRLTEHWRKFAASSPANGTGYTKVVIGIIGKDKLFDEQVRARASASMPNIGKEGYILIFNSTQKLIAANTETGVFYALQSLKQLVRSGWSNEIFIADWPSFPERVVYDDISRGPISTVDYIKHQIDRMAEIKINGLSFYIEHIVQPVSHPDFAPDSGKLTIPQIKELSAYAEEHHMQLIGSFQSFGHFEKILSLPQYRSMGETSTLISPLDPKARKFLEDVIGELCDAFGSPYFNVNCDETFDLTKGRSKKYIDSIGAARFYADHLKFLYDICKKHNKTMMMWGDVALEHEEVLDLLPKDIVYLTWEYGDKTSYDPWIMPFKKRGLHYMVCPGILNSYRMFPDMAMAKANIRSFLEAGINNGSEGAFTTIWDDGGTYLFSGDWYGVYVAADKSWNVATQPQASFDSRYEWNAYGTANGAYVKALFKLMELRAVPLTYNLNDQVWRQKILSDSGKQLIMNNSSAKAALAIIDEAGALLAGANPVKHKTDISTLRFSLDQYKLIVDSRTTIAGVADQYTEAVHLASSKPAEARSLLLKAESSVRALSARHTNLKNTFREAWLKENQPYWLNVVTESYDKKINDLNGLIKTLHKDLGTLGLKKNVPLVSGHRLAITQSSDYYFQNWMLGGPFPFAASDKLPAFLYSENPEYNKPPKPGDFTHYLGKTYRWQKFASQDGGIVDLDENYESPKQALALAYCSITSGEADTVDAFITGNKGMEVFCNGENVYRDKETAPGEQKMQLKLKAGTNHLLIKMPKTLGKPWTFTFRLDNRKNVTTHKHKYQLNAKKQFTMQNSRWKMLMTAAPLALASFCSHAQVKKEELTQAINETAKYVANVILDKEGKSRGDYNITEGKWYEYEVPWHTGQAVYSLLAAYKQTGDKAYLDAAKKGGNWWITMEVKDKNSKLYGMLKATHGDVLGEDFIVFATISDGTPGIYELSRVTKDPKYAKVATTAAAWMLKNMYYPEKGVCYDNIDAKTGEVLKEHSPFWKDKKEQKLFDVSRPNTEGWLFKDAYEFSGEQKFKDAFILLCNSLVEKQGKEGVWMQFMPNFADEHSFHPRFSLWYAESLIECFKLTGDKKYLEAAANTARTFAKAQQKEGTIFYDNYTNGRPPDKGSATGSAVALAGIVWIELAKNGYTEFDDNIEKSARWLVDNRYSQKHPDPNLRGAVLETRTRFRKGKVWFTNRDIGTSFALRFLVDYTNYKYK